MRNTIALISLITILILVNYSIFHKEIHLAEGKIVYLELAPVDPRSLMQGDYMALRFALTNQVRKALSKKDGGQGRSGSLASGGYVVIHLDEQNIGSFKGLYRDQALSEGEVLMRYRVRNTTIKFATNAYFFQEGHGSYYELAKYGQFRVDDKGELLLVAMYDNDLTKLELDLKD